MEMRGGGICVRIRVKRWVGIKTMCMVTYMEPCHAVLDLLGHKSLPLFLGRESMRGVNVSECVLVEACQSSNKSSHIPPEHGDTSTVFE